MALALEISYNLLYKEYTHCDGGRGWKPASTIYRWEKRRMAKVSRRNGRKVVAEYADAVGMELQEQLLFLLAYLSFVEDQEFAKVMVEFMRPMCSGPGNCHICDGKE
jgi:hypothetical protein